MIQKYIEQSTAEHSAARWLTTAAILTMIAVGGIAIALFPQLRHSSQTVLPSTANHVAALQH